ncbi:MAG TPA: winged helix-turn-helix domain-containing protein [Gemmatimonadales bacterium]|nr:winged helix-turn-helix domain-containing protein [Gemmatimonadales bacterium]
MLRRSVADLRALAHPLRLRMMELFAESPRTTKQVADLLGQPPTRLYHHVAALERAGLLVLKEKRKNRGTVEKWYVGIAQQVQGSVAGGAAAGRRTAGRAIAATLLDQAKRELLAMPRDAKHAALLARLVLVVPRRAIAAIRKRLSKAVQEVGAEFHVDPAGGNAAAQDCERWAVTVAFAPVTPSH